jgi:hypothetical protein
LHPSAQSASVAASAPNASVFFRITGGLQTWR